MKLLITQPYLNLKGGAERVLLKIAQHYGAKILTVEYDKKKTFPEFADLDIEVVKRKVPLSSMLPYRAAQGMLAGYTFYNMKIREDYDVLNAHTSPSEWIRHKNERVLWYCHTPIREVYDLYELRMRNRNRRQKMLYFAFTSAYKVLSKDVIRKIEAIATNSENTNSRIKRYFGRSATIINPGVDVKEFRSEGMEKYFFYPSRFYVNKGQDFVIDAFARFQKKTGLKNYKLILAGSLSNDKEHIDYFEKLKAKNVRNVEFMLNATDDQVRELYSHATAVPAAPVNEDYGIVQVEAMASGRVLITLNEGGPKETVAEGKTGFLINSPAEMAERMKWVVEHKDLAERMGKAARRRVEENYSWDAFFGKFDRLAREVAKGKD